MSEKLRFLVPNGSLRDRFCLHLTHAGYPLREPDRTGFCGEFGGIEFHQVDRRMLPHFLRNGSFHAGMTGADLWMNSGVAGLRTITSLCFSRSTDQPSRWVMAKRKDADLQAKESLLVACELDRLAHKLVEPLALPRPWELLRIDGSEEIFVREKVADLVVVVTETGSSIKANGLEIVEGCDTLLVSTPEIRAQPSLGNEQEERLQELSLVLEAFVGSGVFCMVEFDILRSVDLAELRLPCSVAPTVSNLTDPEWGACKICIPRRQLGSTLLAIKRAGGQGIAINDLNGYIA